MSSITGLFIPTVFIAALAGQAALHTVNKNQLLFSTQEGDHTISLPHGRKLLCGQKCHSRDDSSSSSSKKDSSHDISSSNSKSTNRRVNTFKEGAAQAGNVGVVAAFKARNDAREAVKATEEVTKSENLSADQSNAFRHAYWSARMTQSIGKEKAKKVGDKHEEVKPGTAQDTAADLKNNEAGRKIGEEGGDIKQKSSDYAKKNYQK
eukprot:TRINITY_DN95353_c0_g1_i1.p2 TRINITY_DN95353_c0_g1~~TRINITY_DN95353_c0_g1_i1.p2  ORF type:complete len:207 (+),score=41.66 TRINITY_DN95353_c0_g1_i1:73-693(+)